MRPPQTPPSLARPVSRPSVPWLGARVWGTCVVADLPLASLCALALGGCAGSSPPDARTAIDITPPPPGRCELVGVAPGVALTVAGLTDEIELTRSTARYSILAGTDDVEVRAERPLELVARTSRPMVPVRLERRLRSHGIVVQEGVRAIDVVPGEGGVTVTLDVDAIVQLRLAVGCNALALGEATVVSRWVAHDGSPTHELVGDAPLPISASPTDPPFASVLAGVGRQFRVVEVVGVRARIVRALDHGALDGWVDASRLARLAPGTGWEGYGSSCCGGVMGMMGRGRISPLLYEGPAILRRGALVRGEGDIAWARVTEDVHVYVAVRPEPTEPVLVYEIDGVTSHGSASLPSGIVVRRDDLVFPPGTLP